MVDMPYPVHSSLKNCYTTQTIAKLVKKIKSYMHIHRRSAQSLCPTAIQMFLNDWSQDMLHVCHVPSDGPDYQSKHQESPLHCVTDLTFVPTGSVWQGGVKLHYCTSHFSPLTLSGRMESYNTKESQRAVYYNNWSMCYYGQHKGKSEMGRGGNISQFIASLCHTSSLFVYNITAV